MVNYAHIQWAVIPLIELVGYIYPKNIPAKFQKDLNNVSQVIPQTYLLIRTDKQADRRPDRQMGAGNDNIPPVLGSSG